MWSDGLNGGGDVSSARSATEGGRKSVSGSVSLRDAARSAVDRGSRSQPALLLLFPRLLEHLVGQRPNADIGAKRAV